MLKLEKENRELQASIERLKEENHGLQEQQLHTQELERENQSLSNKVRCSQTAPDWMWKIYHILYSFIPQNGSGQNCVHWLYISFCSYEWMHSTLISCRVLRSFR